NSLKYLQRLETSPTFNNFISMIIKSLKYLLHLESSPTSDNYISTKIKSLKSLLHLETLPTFNNFISQLIDSLKFLLKSRISLPPPSIPTITTCIVRLPTNQVMIQSK